MIVLRPQFPAAMSSSLLVSSNQECPRVQKNLLALSKACSSHLKSVSECFGMEDFNTHFDWIFLELSPMRELPNPKVGYYIYCHHFIITVNNKTHTIY